jgi:hypothetical protein
VDHRSPEILDRYRIPSDRSPDLMPMKSSPEVDVATTATTDATDETTNDEPSAIQTSAASQ